MQHLFTFNAHRILLKLVIYAHEVAKEKAKKGLMVAHDNEKWKLMTI